jgi:hypothetical protein
LPRTIGRVVAARWRRLALHVTSAREAALFVRMLGFATLVPLLMRLPLPRLQRIVTPRHRQPPADSIAAEHIAELVDTTIAVAHPVVRPGCLTRSIVLYRFLNAAGFDVGLCFGVGSVDAEEAAHSWIVQDGEPRFEAVDPRQHFVVTYTFPAGTR